MMKSVRGKQIGILGAGVSGLVAGKKSLENGLIPTIFEKEMDLGGVWNPDTGRVWDTLRTNVSKFVVSYGDTQWPQNDPELFPSSLSYFKYLKNYAEKWGINKYIKFNCKVVKVDGINSEDEKDEIGSQGWRVHWSENGGEEKSELFDGIIMATGIFAKGHIPRDIPGLDTFTGEVLHSKDYKSGSAFKGQRVLVVGGGISGTEISADVSNYMTQPNDPPVIHSFRRPFWVIPRITTINTTSASTQNSDSTSTKLFIDWLYVGSRIEAEKHAQLSREDAIINGNDKILLLCKCQQEIEELKISPDEMKAPISVVVSDEYLSKVQAEKIIPKKQNISGIEGSKVKFEDGKVIEVDVIIFSTGYHVGDNILEKGVLDLLAFDPFDSLLPFILFNETVHPDVKNFFFVGISKTTYLGVVEQQARWACEILSGKVALPPRDKMVEGLKFEEGIRNMRPRPQFPHSDNLLFADKIAKCTANGFPDLEKLQSDQYTLVDAFGSGKENKTLDNNAALMEAHKEEINTRFMTQLSTPAHYNLVKDPEETLKQMQFVHKITNNL